jgi:ribosomal protein S1
MAPGDSGSKLRPGDTWARVRLPQVDHSDSPPRRLSFVTSEADDRAWRRIEDASVSGETVCGRVSRAVHGGLILDLGVRALLPWVLIEIDAARVRPLEQYVGETLPVKIIELNRLGHVVVSRRSAA